MSTTTNSNSRKVLVPLATLLVAGAVAVGSGATWTAESDSAVTATAGNLVHVNDQDNATLIVKNLKPGSVETGSLTIENTGSLDSTLKVIPTVGDDDFSNGAVTLTMDVVPGGETPLFRGDFDQFTTTTAVGDLNVGDTVTIQFTVKMDANAPEINQGMAADVALEFVTTQTDGDESSNNNWVPPVG